LGGGELLNECMEYSNSRQLNIVFPGWSRDIYRYIPAADLLLMTSKNEGLGMVMLEAATQSVPTVSTDVGGVSEFLIDGSTGFFAVGDVNGFSHKLIQIRKDPGTLKAVGSHAKVRVTTEFSTEEFVRNHEALYTS
jgi:glycosyltransferase involved in cell wall biosynthesis